MGCSCSVHGSDKIKEEGRHMYIYERRRVGEKLGIVLRHPEPGLHTLGRGGTQTVDTQLPPEEHSLTRPWGNEKKERK